MTPEEAAEAVVQWEGIAVRVAVAYAHRIPAYSFDDLKQECMIGLWNAALSFDESLGNQWAPYAENLVRRRANKFIRVERRRGLTNVGDVADARDKVEHQGPRTWLLGERDEWIGLARVHKDTREVDELLAWLGGQNIEQRTLDIVEMIAQHDMNLSQIAEVMGISRQRVSQILDKVRGLLRALKSKQLGGAVVKEVRMPTTVPRKAVEILVYMEHNPNLSQAEVGRRLGVSKARVNKVVKRYGPLFRELAKKEAEHAASNPDCSPSPGVDRGDSGVS